MHRSRRRSGARALLIGRDDAAGVIEGLYLARRLGRPLRIAPGAAPAAAAAHGETGADEGDHVILVEARADAQALVGAAYAAAIDAPLIVTPAPDVAPVERIIDRLQEAVVEHARRPAAASAANAADEADPDPLPSSRLFGTVGAGILRRLGISDPRFDLLADLERAVSANVASEVVDRVGDRMVTVFGGGTPYSFVRTAASSWADKPIGHVIDDADLVIMNELCSSAAADPPVSFSLVLDPGFFANSETEDVQRSLQSYATKVFLLDKNAQLQRIFFHVANEMPLGFVFFNTHGNDDAILLGDYPLHNFQIAQWLRFDDRPIIFNNSCESWTGVGREFVRVGARGYVGTLWSVATEGAAELARRAMIRMIGGGEPVSRSIRLAEIDELTYRAYLFVGTATARCSRRSARRGDWSSAQLVALLQNNLHLLNSVRGSLSPAEDSFSERLYHELTSTRDELLARDDAAAAGPLIDLMLGELSMLAENSDHVRTTPEYRWELFRKCETILDRTASADVDWQRRRASFISRRGGLRRESRDRAGADADAIESIRLEESFGGKGVAGRQLRIQLAIDENRLDDAIRLAEEARAIFEADGGNLALLATMGRLCQIMKRDPERTDEGIAIAKTAIALAERLGEAREESALQLDLAQLFLVKREPELALAAAKRALAAARRSEYDAAVGELAAYGTLGQCYLLLGRLDEARTHAQRGLERARRLGEQRRVGAFLTDLARIEGAAGRPEEASAYWTQALAVAATVDNPQLWAATVQAGITFHVEQRGPAPAAEWIAQALATIGAMSPQAGGAATGDLFGLVLHLFTTAPAESCRAIFAALFADAERIMGTQAGTRAEWAAGVVLGAAAVFVTAADHGADQALTLAQELDSTLQANGSFARRIAPVVRYRCGRPEPSPDGRS